MNQKPPSSAPPRQEATLASHPTVSFEPDLATPSGNPQARRNNGSHKNAEYISMRQRPATSFPRGNRNSIFRSGIALSERIGFKIASIVPRIGENGQSLGNDISSRISRSYSRVYTFEDRPPSPAAVANAQIRDIATFIPEGERAGLPLNQDGNPRNPRGRRTSEHRFSSYRPRTGAKKMSPAVVKLPVFTEDTEPTRKRDSTTELEPITGKQATQETARPQTDSRTQREIARRHARRFPEELSGFTDDIDRPKTDYPHSPKKQLINSSDKLQLQNRQEDKGRKRRDDSVDTYLFGNAAEIPNDERLLPYLFDLYGRTSKAASVYTQSPEIHPSGLPRQSAHLIPLNSVQKSRENENQTTDLDRKSLNASHPLEDHLTTGKVKSKYSPIRTLGSEPFEDDYDEESHPSYDPDEYSSYAETEDPAALEDAEEYIMLLTRAYMMFCHPSHHLEHNVQISARNIGVECSVIYLVDYTILAFHNGSLPTTIEIIKQIATPNLTRILEVNESQTKVMKGTVSIAEGSARISELMLGPPFHKPWETALIGGCCSTFIGVSTFHAAPIDVLLIFPLGVFLTTTQLYIGSQMASFSKIFEVLIAAVTSFVAAAAASPDTFCYAAIGGASIVLVLPGWPTLLSALELQSRSFVCGSIRLVWAMIYSMYLGFGCSLGAQAWKTFSGADLLFPDGQAAICNYARIDAPWWRSELPELFWILTVPAYLLSIGSRFGLTVKSVEAVVTVIVGSAAWTSSYHVSKLIPGRPDIFNGVGCFVAGLGANLWGRVFHGNAYVITIPAILFQIPSGLFNGGLMSYALTADSSNNSWTSGFTVVQQMIYIVIGMTFGLFLASALVHPKGGNHKNRILV